MNEQGARQISGTEAIGRVVDMEHNEKVKSSAGYAQWANIHNLQAQAKTFNFLTENGLLDGEKLGAVLEEVTAQFKQSKSEMKEVNRELRLLGQYFSTMQTYRAYCKDGKTKKLQSAHRAELELHDAAYQELGEIFGGEKSPSVQALKEEKSALSDRRKKQYVAYQEIRNQWIKLTKIWQNRDSFLVQQPDRKRNLSIWGKKHSLARRNLRSARQSGFFEHNINGTQNEVAFYGVNTG